MTKPPALFDRLCEDLQDRESHFCFYFTGNGKRWTAHLRRDDGQYDLGHGATPQDALIDLYDELEGAEETPDPFDWSDLI